MSVNFVDFGENWSTFWLGGDFRLYISRLAIVNPGDQMRVGVKEAENRAFSDKRGLWGSFPPVLNLFLYQEQEPLSEGKGSVHLTSLLRSIDVKNRIIGNLVSLFFLA